MRMPRFAVGADKAHGNAGFIARDIEQEFIPLQPDRAARPFIWPEICRLRSPNT